jgi:hypothetical protein
MSALVAAQGEVHMSKLTVLDRLGYDFFCIVIIVL